MVEKELLAAKSIFEFIIPIIILRFKRFQGVNEFVKSLPVGFNEAPYDTFGKFGRFPGEEAYSFWTEDVQNKLYVVIDVSFIQNSLVNIRFQLIMNDATDADLLDFRDAIAIPFLNNYTDNSPWKKNSLRLGNPVQKTINDLDFGISIIGRDSDIPSSISFWITQKEYNIF
jgi:hypothetical protein